MTSYAHHFEGMASVQLLGRISQIEQNQRSAGMSWEESKPLFDKLWAHLTQDKYILTIFWKSNGDMVSQFPGGQLIHSRVVF
jgi:hypothetical protein